MENTPANPMETTMENWALSVATKENVATMAKVIQYKESEIIKLNMEIGLERKQVIIFIINNSR